MLKTRMKELKTPFKLFGIRYFKDGDGQYYKKVGANHRYPVKPLWKKKRFKLGLPLILLVVLGFFGYQIGMNLASDKVVNEISQQIPKKDIQALLTDPSIQQVIENEVGADKKQQILDKYSVVPLANTPLVASASNEESAVVESKDSQKATNTGNSSKGSNAGNSSTSKPTPTNQGSNLKFTSRDQVMKFLLSKFTMNELLAYADKAKGGLTPEVKSEIQAAVMQRLTAEEYEALKLYAIIELSKS